MLAARMRCRICARELCGNQRRWIFHPGAKPNLQVLLSHALGRELTRDGGGEFSCSKCAFMLERMFRFDTVVARVEALSLERLHKLLLEKQRLRQCIGGLYRRNNPEPGPGAGAADLHDLRYSDMIRGDLALSVYESWADRDDPGPDQNQNQHQRCGGCAALRVADSDYEAVCKVPRRVGRRSTSCGPVTRMEDPSRTSAGSEAAAFTSEETCEQRSPSPGSSVGSLDDARGEEPGEEPEERHAPWDKPAAGSSSSGLDSTLGLLEYRPVKTRRGSRLPVLVRTGLDRDLSGGVPDQELLDLEEQWVEEYIRCGPFGFQQVDESPGDGSAR